MFADWDKPAACYSAMGQTTTNFWNPTTGRKQPVPRHGEIDNQLARNIMKHLGIKP